MIPKKSVLVIFVKHLYSQQPLALHTKLLIKHYFSHVIPANVWAAICWTLTINNRTGCNLVTPHSLCKISLWWYHAASLPVKTWELVCLDSGNSACMCNRQSVLIRSTGEKTFLQKTFSWAKPFYWGKIHRLDTAKGIKDIWRQSLTSYSL